MNKQIGAILRASMIKNLKRMTEELAKDFQDINRIVEEKTTKKLNLEVVSVTQVKEDDFRIKVKGVSFTGQPQEEEFQVVWWSHTCPAHYHLLQWGRPAFSQEDAFLYCGVIEGKDLARDIAIHTHHMQIPEVLSR